MKVTKSKNGVIKMTATSKKDSLKLLEFLDAMAGDNDQQRAEMIRKKREDLGLIESGEITNIQNPETF